MSRIVIVGGGFGGAFAAKYLRRHLGRDADIEIINSTNYFVFQPLLPEVASGTINAPDAVTPLRYMLKGIRVRMADVIAVDRDKQRITILQGSRRIPQYIDYDHLVIAVGQQTNLEISAGMREHALCMRNLADAHGLRNRVIECLEHADITRDENLKRRLLTFVVAGGGFSGTETIGELIEMIHRTLKFYPNVSKDQIRAVLVQRGDRILPELSRPLGEYAAKKLGKRNVDIRCHASVASATATAVFLDNGERIDTATFISTVGSGPTGFTSELGIDLERGKIPVDEYLQIKGSQSLWALGDAALIPLPSADGEPRFAPPTAQYAVREAKCLAGNIAALHQGRELQAFAFRPWGSLASIGHYSAVAELFGLRLSGLTAWLLWRAIYIGMLPGFSTRLRVALNWLFDYFLPRSIVQIANRRSAATQYRRYARGDVISGEGQIVDGFYTVISGYLESRIPDPHGGEDFVRILGPGDHWGERSLTEHTRTVGTLTAAEDATVMVLPADDFHNLCDAFPVLDDYFEKISDKIYAPSLRKH
ncbi:MAG: FAD-dependent oxidoreductase [Woeseiaceae bacterium]|nr:FAD-dependent oxidoreductase [Woeseiaceae bacterium]